MAKNAGNDERKKLCDLLKDALYDLQSEFTPEKAKGIEKLVEELKAVEQKAKVKEEKWVLYADQLKTILKKQKQTKKTALKKSRSAMEKSRKEPLPKHMVS